MSIQNNLPSWLPLSFVLAQHLNQHQVHKRFLTSTERKYFEDALTSYATWIAFIDQTIKKAEESLTELDTTAFRVRSMLYEQLIPHLFQTHTKSCCSVLKLEPLFDQARQWVMPSIEEIAGAWESYLDTHAKVKKEEPSPTLPDPNTLSDETTPKPVENQNNEEQSQQQQQQPQQQQQSKTR
jgi:transcriptional activator SPT7